MGKKLFIWLNHPPVCCKGIFDSLAEAWDEDVTYVCLGNYNDVRAKIASSDDCGVEPFDSKCVKYAYFPDYMNKQQEMQSFVRDHRDDIHIFNGYLGTSSVFLNYLLEINPKAMIIIWAEKFNVLKKCSRLVRFLLAKMQVLKHRLHARKYRKAVRLLMPLGQAGVRQYAQCGWPAERLMPFLYSPVMNESLPEDNLATNPIVRFVYLGRFCYNKGLDLLLKACRKLDSSRYRLTVVGGYGEYLELVKEEAKRNPCIEFGGTWPIREACDRLHRYDVCVVPSRIDGWNVTINEALMAGIGCIVTDATVSDEMISTSHAGMVVPANDVGQLTGAMQMVLDNPDLIPQWKKAAYRYRGRISSKVLSRYFADVLHFLVEGGQEASAPHPPWLD